MILKLDTVRNGICQLKYLNKEINREASKNSKIQISKLINFINKN